MAAKYVLTLDASAFKRYRQKTEVINGVDPYTISKGELCFDVNLFPSITYPDIANYFLFSPSPLTREELKAYKGLESYNFFVSGFVRDVGFKEIGDIFVITGRVKHSQRMNDKPLQPWVLCRKDGTILSAHCDCMAGLGESCSHVGAIMFYVEYSIKQRENKTCTQEKAYWLVPPRSSKIEYKMVSDIDFTTPKTLHKLSNNKGDKSKTIQKSYFERYATPTDSEFDDFCKDISECGTKPVILSVTPGYSQNYRPQTVLEGFPRILSTLYDPSLTTYDLDSLEDYCKNIVISITPAQQSNVEEATRAQTSSPKWFSYRTGRITASKIFDVCRTSVNKPSVSLIKSICYPEAYKFSTVATTWGCQHEKVALEVYRDMMISNHINFHLKDSGFHISIERPYLGASPDALVFCDCCGDGCLEIKCPYVNRECDIDEISTVPESCLQKEGNIITLKRNHRYYYQVQCQLYVTKRNYCDFYLWTLNGQFHERILYDETFLNNDNVELFFRRCVLASRVSWQVLLKVKLIFPSPVSITFCNQKVM